MRSEKIKPLTFTKTICNYLQDLKDTERKNILECFYQNYQGNQNAIEKLTQNEKAIYKFIANIKNQTSLKNKINGSKGGGQYGNQNARKHKLNNQEWQLTDNDPEKINIYANEIMATLQKLYSDYINNQKKQHQKYFTERNTKQKLYKDTELYYQLKTTDYSETRKRIKSKLVKGDTIKLEYLITIIDSLPTIARIKKANDPLTYTKPYASATEYETMLYYNDHKTLKDFMKNKNNAYHSNKLYPTK